jgi:short subunit fatty acids transporter
MVVMVGVTVTVTVIVIVIVIVIVTVIAGMMHVNRSAMRLHVRAVHHTVHQAQQLRQQQRSHKNPR